MCHLVIISHMKLHWRDENQKYALREWQGLALTAQGAERPGVEVGTCHPHCIRLSVRGAPLVWTRIEDDYWGFERLRASGGEPMKVIPPLPFGLVNELASKGNSVETDPLWAREFARLLEGSEASPITTGSWHLGRFGAKYGERMLSAELTQRIVHQPAYEYVEWDFGDGVCPILLRDISRPDSGRVKAWRKRVQEGSLPPVLLYWVSGFATYVVLDGHDRLLAAALEGVAARALALESIRQQDTDEATKEAVLAGVSQALEAAERERSRPKPERLARASRLMSVERANELLLQAFVPTQYTGPTTAYPLKGGVARWSDEVRRELAVREITESTLLAGL